MSKILFGWAEADITPEKKVALSGQFAERISEYVEKPLCATALAIKSENEHCIFVSCDLVGASANLIDAVREKLSGNPYGIDPMKVILNAIHTHTGPEYPRDQRTRTSLTMLSQRQLIQSFLPPGKKYIEKENVSNNPDIASPQETFDFLVEKITGVVLDAFLKFHLTYYSPFSTSFLM